MGLRLGNPRGRVVRQTLLVLLALPLVMVGSYLSYLSVREYQAIGPAISHSSEVLEVSSDLLADLRAAESAQRGYILTSRSNYLNPYYVALPHINQELARLAHLDPGQGSQATLVAEVDQLARRKLQELQQTVELTRNGKHLEAIAIVQSGQGMQLMETLVGSIRRLQAAERKQLDRQSSQTAQQARNAFLLSTIGDLVLLLFLAMAALVINRESRRSERDQVSIQLLNEKLEQELTERSAILESIGDGFCAFDHQWRARYVNAAAERILGGGRQDLVGKHLNDVFPNQSAAIAGHVREVLDGQPTASFEGYFPRYERWLRLRFYPGAESSFSFYFTDITEEKEAETEREKLLADAQQARALLDTFFEKAPVGLAFWDCDLRFERVNEALAKMNGFPAEAHRGKTIDEMFPGFDPTVTANLRHVVQTGQSILARETSGVTPAQPGRLRHWLVSYYPIRIQGVIVGAGALSEDITERKTIEESLRQSAKLESLGVLAGGIAHDFNNLLTGILGNASLAMETLSPNNPARNILQDVVAASERAAHLTRQLLAYAGKGRFVLNLLDLSQIVGEISSLVRTSIGRHVQLRLELQPHLPCIYADGSQMQQLVMNLVINAAEAIPADQQGSVIVTTGSHAIDEDYIRQTLAPAEIEPGKYVYLEVHDTGVGMDETTIARIFDPFFTTKFTGRGLGLAAVLGIVRGHRGALKVYSTPGRGTTFKVLLPATEEQINREMPVAAQEDLTGTATILIVDDEEVVRRTTKSALERYGYNVLLADNGKEGVDVLRVFLKKISLVILDLTMPVMSGEQTLREMRALRPDLPVILSSGFNEQESIQHFTGKGLAGFLQKPYTAQRLAEGVGKVLRKNSGL